MSKIKVSNIIDFNPKRPLKKGHVAPFIEMASLPQFKRDVSLIEQREFKGGGSKFRNGDTLFARITPCLENGKTAKVMLLDNEVVAHGSTEFIVMSAKDSEIDEDYVYYLARLPEFRKYAESRMEGTSGRQRVSWQALSEFEMEMPVPAIRKVAGNVLRSFDDKIQLNQTINQKLEKIAQSVFKSWFVDFDPVIAKVKALETGGTEDDALLAAMTIISGKDKEQLEEIKLKKPHQFMQLRDIAQLFPSSMQNSDIGKIPNDWNVRTLASMVEIIGGGTPKRSENSYWGGETGWFSVRDVPQNGDIFVIETDEKITDIGMKKSSTKLLPEGVTIITARGTVGKLALVGKPICMNQSCYGVKGVGVGDYFNYFNLQQAVSTLLRNTHGAVFDTITTKTFDTYSFPFCGGELAEKFDTFVAPLIKKIKNNVLQNQKLAEIRDNLLPKLLSGELEIGKSNSEEAI